MLEIKLTHFPSGEKLGDVALPTRAIRATDAATFFLWSACGSLAARFELPSPLQRSRTGQPKLMFGSTWFPRLVLSQISVISVQQW
jgi:hypothetical protein